jgi:peptidoglycan/xylan/chitin deacetylase (PgdA/CDA1 family)
MIKEIGLVKEELGWQQVLNQEGVNYELIPNLSNLERYGVVILSRHPVGQEIPALLDHIDYGGSILTDFPGLKALNSEFKYRKSKFRYVVPTSGNIFNNVGVVDFGQKGFALPRTNKPGIYSENYGKGKIIALPFDINQALLNTKTKPKSFYYTTQRFPYETVAEVSKGEVRKLAVNCLRELIRQQNLYYTHLWYYPDSNMSVFTFRVDTDFSPWDNIQSVIKLAQENDMNFTWFVNTKAQKDDLHKFKTLQDSGQDMQLHCFAHNVYSDYMRNRVNIIRGKEVLREVGIEPIGFAAPFGEWNENLARVLEELNFQYSSEFGFTYDDLPSYPIVLGQKSRVLQIPIHPICVGRLLQANLDIDQISDYFMHYINLYYQAHEPIMIYDHPHRIHQFPKVFDAIFKKVKEMKGIWITNFTQFTQWWKRREAIIYNATIENGQLKIITPKENPNFSLHLISPTGQEAFIPLKNGFYHLDKLAWSTIPEGVIADEGIERIRKGISTLQIKEFVNTLNRRLKGQRS